MRASAGAPERHLADWVADGQGHALGRRKPAAPAAPRSASSKDAELHSCHEEAWPLIERAEEEKTHDEHEENPKGSREERTPQR